MEQIQKAAHYRSYYESAKKLKDPVARLAFYDAIDAYRFDGIEPENLPFEADLLFTAIRSFIDADLGRKCGGAPKGNQNARKQSIKTTEKQPENNPLIQPKTNNEEVEEEVKENVNGEEKEVVSLSPMSQDFAQKVFDVLTENDLPCCNMNFISFINRDFRNGIETLHRTMRGLHSDEIIQAVKNYALVVNNNHTWHGWKTKKTFDRFVSWERFKDFLPGNFILDNFLEYSTPKGSQGVGKEEALRIAAEMGI